MPMFIVVLPQSQVDGISLTDALMVLATLGLVIATGLLVRATYDLKKAAQTAMEVPVRQEACARYWRRWAEIEKAVLQHPELAAAWGANWAPTTPAWPATPDEVKQARERVFAEMYVDLFLEVREMEDDLARFHIPGRSPGSVAIASRRIQELWEDGLKNEYSDEARKVVDDHIQTLQPRA